MKNILLAITLFSSFAFANTSKNEACELKKELVMRSSIIASNIANIETTRTPEGGPYKPKALVCKNHICEVIERTDFIEEYEPEHLDSDMAGFVKYPKLNIEDEMTALNKNTQQLREVNKLCP